MSWKLSCTVWGGGKSGDYIKGLPIVESTYSAYFMQGWYSSTVSGRELHAALEVRTQYSIWFDRMCEYGFSEGIDYYSFLNNRSDGLAGKPRTDHQLTIDMAKELCMIQRMAGLGLILLAIILVPVLEGMMTGAV